MRPNQNSELNELAASSSTAATPCEAGNLRIRRHYDGSFKLHAVMKLFRGEKQTEVGQELGVSQPLLSIWKSRALAAVDREFGVAANEQEKPGSARSSLPRN